MVLILRLTILTHREILRSSYRVELTSSILKKGREASEQSVTSLIFGQTTLIGPAKLMSFCKQDRIGLILKRALGALVLFAM